MCDTDYTGGELRAMAQELVAKVLAEDPFVAPEVAGHPELFCREVSEELASAPKEIQESVLNVQSGAQRNKEAMAWAKARAEERKARAREAKEDEERPWSPGPPSPKCQNYPDFDHPWDDI